MDCPECQFENEANKKFCTKCGTKLSPKCPSCASEIGAEDLFCGECGRNLTAPATPSPQALTPDDKIAKIQRYLPQGLADKILSQRDKIEGERKNVTVMFCDLEGFTGLTEKLDPEDAYALMDQIYEILIHKVHDFEGTVNEMTGDGILALFGAPIALEDAPQRAIRAAIAIHREMVRFNDKMREERPGLPMLKMRIGVHTGPVVVGTLGNDLRVEFKAVGDTVNLASRMEGMAEPGTTYVSRETFKLTEGLFRFEGLGEREIKGKEEPVSVYRVIAPSTRRTRFDVSAEGGLTPFVGRARELELLLEAFERTKGGRGQAVSIVADAGVGKSRLLYEFRKAVANEDVIFLEGKCLSFTRGVAYQPVVDILKGSFDVHDGDADEAVRDKVQRGLQALHVDDAATMPYLLELLFVKGSGFDQVSLSPEGKKDQTIRALNRIVMKGAEFQPLIVAVEDLHWIDPSSEDAFHSLFEQIAAAQVLLVFTYRPEYVHTWAGRSYHSQVTLNRLSNRGSLAIVAHLLGNGHVDDNLADLVLEKTEGVPFFIEELVKSLKDLRLIERQEHTYVLTKNSQDVAIPSTIQDVITARVDSLPPDAKEVLQTGSVVEREFPYALIRRVTSLPERELLSHISVLKDAELLYERGIYPDSIFVFKHALTRDVVYDSILTGRRKELHREIGEAIEDLNRVQLPEHYEALVEHFVLGAVFDKAAKYARLAYRRAEKVVSFPSAIQYAEQTIHCLERLSPTDRVLEKIVEARTTLAMYLAQLFHFQQAKDTVQPILAVAERLSDKRRRAQISSVVGAYDFWVDEDVPQAVRRLTNALEFGTESNDPTSQFFANAWLAFVSYHDCDFDSSLRYFERARDINSAAGADWGVAVLTSCLGLVHNAQGQLELGHQMVLQAIQIAEESGDIYSKASSYYHQGISLFYRGLLDEAERSFQVALDFGGGIGWNAISSWIHDYLGRIFIINKKYNLAEENYKVSLQRMEQERAPPAHSRLAEMLLARTRAARGCEIDVTRLNVYVDQNKIKLFHGSLRRYLTEILLHGSDECLSEAEALIEDAIEADKQRGMMWDLAMDHAVSSMLWKKRGDRQRSQVAFDSALEILKDCGADGWVRRYEKNIDTVL